MITATVASNQNSARPHSAGDAGQPGERVGVELAPQPGRQPAVPPAAAPAPPPPAEKQEPHEGRGEAGLQSGSAPPRHGARHRARASTGRPRTRCAPGCPWPLAGHARSTARPRPARVPTSSAPPSPRAAGAGRSRRGRSGRRGLSRRRVHRGRHPRAVGVQPDARPALAPGQHRATSAWPPSWAIVTDAARRPPRRRPAHGEQGEQAGGEHGCPVAPRGHDGVGDTSEEGLSNPVADTGPTTPAPAPPGATAARAGARRRRPQ